MIRPLAALLVALACGAALPESAAAIHRRTSRRTAVTCRSARGLRLSVETQEVF